MKNFIWNLIVVFVLYGVANLIYLQGQNLAYKNAIKILNEKNDIKVVKSELMLKLGK